MHFIRLIRPLNLIIIALTMYSVRFFYFVLGGAHSSKVSEQFDFFLLVFSTVLIAAGGNIINDYFDVRADRINRPEKLIITKYIKRRWAIISHWSLNLIAFSIAIYLSLHYHTFWYVFIHLLTINSLWFYSMYFKRKPFIGNLLIAALTALVPILCGIHFYLQIDYPRHHLSAFPAVETLQASIFEWKNFLLNKGRFIYVLAYFAFTLNLSRELIKDIEDIEGDQLIYAKTLPLVLGVKKSLWIASIITLSAPICFTILFLLEIKQDFAMHLLALLPLAFSSVLNCVSVLFLLKKPEKITLKRADFVLKIAMLSGILIPFYWWIILR
jgi:4-hydroxybenzoate polyprenyltransferase